MSDHQPSFDVEDLERADKHPWPKGRSHVFVTVDEASPMTKRQMKQAISRMHRNKELLIMNLPAKNCIFRDIIIYGQHFIAGVVPVRENEVLSFRHEKNNLHDAFAIKAYNKDNKPVGWVPKEISPALVRMLRDGYKITGIAHIRATRMWPNKTGFSCDMFAKKGCK